MSCAVRGMDTCVMCSEGVWTHVSCAVRGMDTCVVSSEGV